MLIPSVVMLLWLAYISHHRKRYRELAESEYLPAQVRFFEQTGYRVLGHEYESLEAQARVVILGPADAAGGLLCTDTTPCVQPALVCGLDGARLIDYPPGSRGGPLDRCGWVLELHRPVLVRWSLRSRNTLLDHPRQESDDCPSAPSPASYRSSAFRWRC